MSKLDKYALENLASKVDAPVCCDCGTVMVIKKATDPISLGKFDKRGNRQYIFRYKCPNRKWYQLGFLHPTLIELVKEANQ